jgi:hypothetical protein
MVRTRGEGWRWTQRVLLALLLLLLVLAAATALDNRRLLRHSSVVDRLTGADKARLTEALHLRQALGDSLWPGLGREPLAVVLYNERYAFLVGVVDPAPGWIKVPGGRARGGAWEAVPGDSLAGAPCYRLRLPGPGVDPEAFTVRIGTRWAASLPTFEWSGISLADQMRGGMPGALAAVFPLRRAVALLIGGTDGYLALLQHEAFHAHQGMVAPGRLAAAERATALEGRYPASPEFERAWRRELGLLVEGVRAPDPTEARELARRFLESRRLRRRAAGLGDSLIACERQREWLEGLAKYAELESWRRAARTPGYRPLGSLAADREFRGYAGFEARWSRELMQARVSSGDVRFYYSGLGQAALLDRLLPGWKNRALADGVWLEDLLAEAVTPGSP